MPLLIERLTNPTEQDVIDLGHVYHDYPFKPPLEPLIKQSLPKDYRWYAGRFNGRLLAACLLIDASEGYIIEHLCVRSITRSRHIGRDLLRQLMQQTIGSLSINVCQASPTLSHLLQCAGFARQPDSTTWVFIPQ